MRLWHKDLISVLPKQQLMGQWRECCLIAKNIAENGTPNHLLVNKVLNYPIEHFWVYGRKVFKEIKRRGYSADWQRFNQYFDKLSAEYEYDDIFTSWHNYRYMRQCLYNLQEKYDCGGITEDEWNKIKEVNK